MCDSANPVVSSFTSLSGHSPSIGNRDTRAQFPSHIVETTWEQPFGSLCSCVDLSVSSVSALLISTR